MPPRRKRDYCRDSTTRGFARTRTPMSNDQLLQELNGHSVDGNGDSWRIHVYSIVDGDAHRWIQLGLEGPETRTVLLKLTYLADACDAIGSIEQWMRNSSCRHGALLPVIPAD